MPEINYNGKRSFVKPVSPDATGDETVKLIVKTINTYSQSPFVKKTVEILKKQSPDRMSFLKNLFGVACKNVKYLADSPGHEVVYTPLLLMRMGKGDCKKFTTFIGAVLKAVGYDGVPKVVKYDPTKDWEHIYIISRNPDGNGYVTLDPVNHCNFDSEVRFAKARENYLDGTYSKIMDGNKLSLMGNLPTDMDATKFMSGVNESANTILTDLAAISGTGCAFKSYHNRAALRGLRDEYINGVNDEDMINGDEDGISGVGDIGKARRKAQGSKRAAKPKKSKAEKKEKRKKFFQKAKKFSPALASIRIAFLSLVKLGGALQKMKGININIAKKLDEAIRDPQRGKEVLDIWYKFGGDKNALMKAIAQAAKTKMHGIGLTPEEMLAQNMSGGIGVAPAVAAAAVITAATPILIPIIKMLKKSGKVSPEQADVIEGGVDAAERVAMTANEEGGLTPNAAKALLQSKIVRESMDDDRGGNQATTRDIQQEAAQENEVGEPTTDFKEGARPRSKGAPGDEATKTANVDASLVPVKLNETPQAVGKSSLSSLTLPTVWIRICLLAAITCNFISVSKTVLNSITSICLLAMIVTLIIQFTNNKTKHNG